MKKWVKRKSKQTDKIPEFILDNFCYLVSHDNRYMKPSHISQTLRLIFSSSEAKKYVYQFDIFCCRISNLEYEVIVILERCVTMAI